MAFVLSLGSRKLYGYQFSQFGYCHMALLVVVGQSTLLAANVFSGFIWCVLLVCVCVGALRRSAHACLCLARGVCARARNTRSFAPRAA